MNNYQPYPWQTSLWAGLIGRFRAGRLPHALLLVGPSGLGKRDFAERFSYAVLCNKPTDDGYACGQCQSCQLLQAGSHPDYLRVEPEEEGKAIGIDRARELARFQSLKSQYGGKRVIQLQPADALNANAANALLKTLEEPAGDTLLLLTTDHPMALLPTIRSRCQQITFHPATDADSATIEWLRTRLPAEATSAETLLQMADGAPLRALAIEEGAEVDIQRELLSELAGMEGGDVDPVSLAARWYEAGSGVVLPWFYRLLSDIVKLKMAPRTSRLSLPHLSNELQPLSEKVDLEFIQALAQKVQERMRLVRGQANQQALLEDLLLAWKQRRV